MRSLFFLLLFSAESLQADWSSYGGPGGRQHTNLTAITPENVAKLTNLWTFKTGDLSDGFQRKGYTFQVNSVLWNGALYIVTSSNIAIAVDAATGEELWRFDAKLDRDRGYSESAARGVSLWHGDDNDKNCNHRVFMGTLDGFLYALDALTGETCTDFGESGRVNMSSGMENATEGNGYSITSPPVIAGNRLIVGSAIGDNRQLDSELGIVRALDVRSGAEIWRWDPIPRSEGDDFADTWRGPQARSTGAANVWAPMSLDEDLGLVFASTSSPSPDFYGGERLGDNRYANSLVALHVDSGEVAWHFQLVHHDVWDYDTPSQPTLFSLEQNGGMRDAVAIVTKTAMMYVFDRSTGEPLFDIVETAVPQSDIDGEMLARTQPFSSLPALVEQGPLTADDAFGLAFFDKRACGKMIREYRTEGVFTPPSLTGSIMNPGYPGGSNWGGVAIDEARQIAIANANRFAVLVKLRPRELYESEHSKWRKGGWQVSQQLGTPYFMIRKVFLSPLGLPCTRPPWGTISAIDLASGQLAWSKPFGTIEDLAPGPIPNFEWGVPNMGGPMTTASGLIFIGAAGDFYIRALSTVTGEELWKQRLPTSANATPMSYELKGKQYVVIAVGGHSEIGLPRGDTLMAFGLP